MFYIGTKRNTDVLIESNIIRLMPKRKTITRKINHHIKWQTETEVKKKWEKWKTMRYCPSQELKNASIYCGRVAADMNSLFECMCANELSRNSIYWSWFGASTPAWFIRSPMLFSKSSIRLDISSMREITWSDIDWNLSWTFWSKVCTCRNCWEKAKMLRSKN